MLCERDYKYQSVRVIGACTELFFPEEMSAPPIVPENMFKTSVPKQCCSSCFYFAFIENVHRATRVLPWLLSAGTRHKIENWDIVSSKIRGLVLIFFLAKV